MMVFEKDGFAGGTWRESLVYLIRIGHGKLIIRNNKDKNKERLVIGNWNFIHSYHVMFLSSNSFYLAEIAIASSLQINLLVCLIMTEKDFMKDDRGDVMLYRFKKNNEHHIQQCLMKFLYFSIYRSSETTPVAAAPLSEDAGGLAGGSL